MPQGRTPSPALFDDYDGTFYDWEPAINHHHVADDGSEVVFHDHDGTRDHTHYDNYGPAHYYGNVVQVDYLNGRFKVIIDYDPDHYTVHHNLVDYRGS